jgi:hypothetical protein
MSRLLKFPRPRCVRACDRRLLLTGLQPFEEHRIQPQLVGGLRTRGYANELIGLNA